MKVNLLPEHRRGADRREQEEAKEAPAVVRMREPQREVKKQLPKNSSEEKKDVPVELSATPDPSPSPKPRRQFHLPLGLFRSLIRVLPLWAALFGAAALGAWIINDSGDQRRYGFTLAEIHIPESRYRAGEALRAAEVRDRIRLGHVRRIVDALDDHYTRFERYPNGRDIIIGEERARCLTAPGWTTRERCILPTNPAANSIVARVLPSDPRDGAYRYTALTADSYTLSFTFEVGSGEWPQGTHELSASAGELNTPYLLPVLP